MSDEKSQQQTSTESTVAGAAKAGKAISNIAKGAAAGGAHGAAIEAGKSSAKWLIPLIAAVLLPLILVAMLPSIIFGSLLGDGTDSPNGISNDEVLVQNMTAINEGISSILSEGLTDVLERIDSDFASSGCDGKEINNPFGADVVFNANAFVSQYCAHKDTEIASISKKDISNGKSYVEIIGNNQMITTAYIDRAHTFNNKKTAEKYCSLLPKAMKNLKYKVIFISNPNPENPDLQLELLTPEFYLTRLKNFSDFIHTIQCQRETLVTGQRKAELEIEDIEHAAEFYNLDASHGYQLYKLLHDARVRRRKCKNAIAWIDYILEQAPDRFIENDPSPRIAGTRSRDYAPRALPALFEWENEGQTPTANLCP